MTARRRRVGSALLAFAAAGAPLAPGTPLSAQQEERIPPRPVAPPAAFQRALEAGTRSPDGRPGGAYWQQRADYVIEAELDPASGVLSGSETITYHNRSPDTLRMVVLRLEQNVYAEGARRNRRVVPTGGIEVSDVRVDGVPAVLVHPGSRYTRALTLGEVELAEALPPGGTVRLSLDFRFTVPTAPTFRQGNVGGELFGLAQWYPRMAVYDDVYGWDLTPYLGDGEFYLEYGDFDVRVTVPAGWVVGATGTLLNPEEVLTDEGRRRLAGALESDTVVRVVTPEEVAGGRATRPGGRLTWRFAAESVRDFAFATSADYVWDARGVEVRGPEGRGPEARDQEEQGPEMRVPAVRGAEEQPARRVLAQAFYRPELGVWRKRGVEFVAHTLADLSQRLGAYPYPQLAIAEGPTGGMEYPMFIFNPSTDSEGSLAGVTIHEGAHQWFPMVVGTMEAKHAWMDEGVVSYWDEISAAALFGRPPPRWGENRRYLRTAGTEREVPLMRHTDLVSPYGERGLAAYTKPAVVLGALRSVVGDSVFLGAFRDFYRSWSFRHPQPWDFFATVERHAGRDLDWFWRPLFFETDVLDHAVASVEQEGGRSRVVLRDLGDVVLPTPVELEMADGTVRSAYVPARTWLEVGRRHTLVVPGRVVRVTLDPEARFPDVDRSNNGWPAEDAASSGPRTPKP